MAGAGGGCNDVQWCFSQVKGAIDDDVAEADIISTVEFNHSGELLATGDKGGRVVIFQQEPESKNQPQCRGEYNVYSTFQSHEPEFDYLKSLEIEEKINKIRWLPQKNAAQFLLSTNDKTIKLWKISERDKRPEGYNLKEEDGRYRDPNTVTTLRVPVFRPMDLMVEASPRRVFANAHTYHINSISVNSDCETYLSADDLRINLKNQPQCRGEYNVYSTFQSHEPEFDYLKSLEIEEKINKIRWLPQKNAAQFLLSTNGGQNPSSCGRSASENKRPEGYNLKEEERTLPGPQHRHHTTGGWGVPVFRPMDLMVEASPRRVFANAHTYHINSISELTEVITAAEFHPNQCNTFVYSSSKGTIRLCDMRASALCDQHSKMFEEPEDPNNRSFFSEIISSISDVKFSHSGRYMMTRDYLSVHEYLRSKLCSLYENDCIFDKFECCWNGNDSVVMTGSYNNFFRMFDRGYRQDVTLEASRENSKPRSVLKPRKVCTGGKRKKDEISVDSLDFNKKILHTAWHPLDNIIAVATTNNLYIFQDKLN
ncbi:hypothetical protein CRUP_023908 [Coryphaenoides rupestris]|nr:hypothetical protein CRUP_023908 [Coryphaenoides rupestris]